MATPNYIIKMRKVDWDEMHDTKHKDALAIAASERDSKIRVNSDTFTIEIDDYSYGDFNNIHRAFKNAMRAPASGAGMWMREFGTDAFRKEEEKRIADSREEMRAVVSPTDDPNKDLPDEADALSGTKDILDKSPGVCLGHGHNQGSAYQYLADIVDNPDTFGSKGGMLFIEELPAYLQTEIDTYLSAKDEPAWSEQAQTFFDSVTKARNLKGAAKLESVLQKAREKDIKIFCIDSGECSPSMAPASAFGEQRTANMNAFAKEVMDKAIKDNPERKFVAFCGAAHSNTHEGGIPGLSQIYNIPAVDLTDDGKIKPDPEDRSLRGMPPKEVQLFVDNFLIGYDNEVRANRVPGSEMPDPDKQKAMAMDIATRLQKAGKLPDPTSMTTDQLRDAIKKIVDKIPKGKDQRYQAAKGAISGGKSDELGDLLTLDPGLSMMRDKGGKTDGQNLLQHATDAGAKNASALLRTTMTETGDAMIANGEPLGTRDLAELIVIKAEDKAWAGDDDDKEGNVNVNPKKHKAMVAELTGVFEKDKSKLSDPKKVVDTLTGSLATDGGFYKKGKKWIGKRDPDHVSIDKKKAAKIWVKELAAL